MSLTPLQRYIEIKRQIAALESELESLKQEVFKQVDGQGGEIAEDSYVIRSYSQPTYEFSTTYQEKNAELKQLRKAEIESGSATIASYSEYVKLIFKKPKADTAE